MEFTVPPLSPSLWKDEGSFGCDSGRQRSAWIRPRRMQQTANGGTYASSVGERGCCVGPRGRTANSPWAPDPNRGPRPWHPDHQEDPNGRCGPNPPYPRPPSAQGCRAESTTCGNTGLISLLGPGKKKQAMDTGRARWQAKHSGAWMGARRTVPGIGARLADALDGQLEPWSTIDAGGRLFGAGLAAELRR